MPKRLRRRMRGRERSLNRLYPPVTRFAWGHDATWGVTYRIKTIYRRHNDRRTYRR